MACILQPTGCLFGYWVSRFSGLTKKDQRTISLECGVQSFTLTIAVINLTFSDDARKDALTFPLCYGILYFSNSGGLVSFYRWYLAPLDGDDDTKPGDVSKVPTEETAESTDPSDEEAIGAVELSSVAI